MKLPVDFSDAEPTDTIVYTIDFVQDLAVGDSIATAAWQIIVSSGVDPLASAHTVGAPVIVGTEVRQTVGGLISGNYYVMRALVTTALGNKVSLFSHVRSD